MPVFEVTIHPNTLTYIVGARDEEDAIDIAKGKALGEIVSDLHYAECEVEEVEHD